MKAGIRSNLTVQILSGVVIVFAALCGLVSYIGYYEFTEALEDQYEARAYNTARTAETFITPGFLSSVNLLSPEWRAKYDRIRGEWQRLANTQGATFIYLYQKVDRGYDCFRVLMSVMNSSAPYTVFASGSIIEDMPEIYQPAYRNIYEDEEADRAVVTVYREEFGSGEFKSGDHITVLLPIRDAQGGVRAVLGVERQMQELQNVRSAYVRDVFLATVALLLVALLAYGMYLNRHLLTPIRKIAGEALRFARENTHPSVPLGQSIRDSNEIGQLARTIDQMEIDIRDYIEDLTRVTKEKEQIQAELNVATQIQADMLPRKFPPFPERREFALYATMTPAKEVGGDFYDFFLIDDDHLALVIADVSGKGVPAALFMVIAKTLIKNRAAMGGSPAEILGTVNNQLCDGNEAGLFVTVWLGILEISTGKVAVANAGHEYPAVKRVDGAWELMKAKHSPAVAVREGMKFRENEFELHPGDSLYLYTDGVAEATNAKEELYGTDLMIEALNRHADEPVEELLPSMKREIDTFVGDAPQFDDITMLALRYDGLEERRLNNNADELTLEARTENLSEVLAFLCGRLEGQGCPPKTQRQVEVAAEEIFVNIAHYAYAPDTGSATVRFGMEERTAVITFIDSGVPYDPLAKPDPDLTLPSRERPIGGLGIFMVKKTMDSVTYERKDGQNIFTMRKTL